MQSSYSVIKNNSVLNANDKRRIDTFYEHVSKEESIQSEPQKIDDSIVESYKNIGENIIKSAKQQKETMLSKAYEEAQQIEKEAYEKAYDEGSKNGYEDGYKQGYKESYEKHIEQATLEANAIVENASNILLDAKKQYEEYLVLKKNEIVKLAYNMAENIVKEKLEKEDGIINLLEEVIEKSKESSTFVIKCNKNHIESIENEIEKWKLKFALKGEIFVLEDSSLESGNAVVEKQNGKVMVGLDIGLEKLRENLF
ncbi:flagellar assembly protein FliH [Clostridium cavendishii DSM 21758]|uniref:Flagellar assembly protein FliH n=1 Tax=Clostridium cavendishii DSM 21758 TaxID=1121302 RepID=A0A1M6AVF7_9CLOT|nr:FliH/SctL family protein [Clostridium cavendishii]SHI40427.1 flagellar assembly protein FliH [Clostridium cavendishii DSM 21758]